MTIGYIGNAGAHLKSQEENINNMPKSNFARGDALVSYDLRANGVEVAVRRVQRAGAAGAAPVPAVRLHRNGLLPAERGSLVLSMRSSQASSAGSRKA